MKTLLRTLSSLLALMLCSTVAIASPQDDDSGTLPLWGGEGGETVPYLSLQPIEFTHYLVVTGPQAELHGSRVVHELAGGRAQYVYEFVGLTNLMQPVGPVSTNPSVASTWSFADNVTAGTVFGNSPRFDLDPNAPPPLYSCQSSACSEENAVCTGWCDVWGNWQCVCTPWGSGSGSGAIARKHKKRLEELQEVFPPQPQPQ